jgi:phosphoribosylaminoimidazolecarboxamide formyltransferase/IMP cyclohydrolase
MLVSTGGTARHLAAAGLAVTDVAAVTGFPEIMDGRVKTLHPGVFGGILCRRDRAEDLAALAELGLSLFDFVVVNLYPFRETVARAGAGQTEAIENIDIGGPSLIRAAAKNHSWVTVLTGPEQYQLVAAELAAAGATSAGLRRRLMVEAFRHTAAYDAAIAAHFSRDMAADLPADEARLPTLLNLSFRRHEVLRYGENSHQVAAVYRSDAGTASGLPGARQLHGKQLSYNNLLDLDAAMGIVARLGQPAVAVIKHNNPCGAATHMNLAEAARRAFAGDPQSAFGGVVAMNRTVNEETARWLGGTAGLFVEAIAAPAFSAAAVGLLTTLPKWKASVRLVEVPGSEPAGGLEFRSIAGGLLVQERDDRPDEPATWKLVTGCPLPDGLQAELEFAWSLVRAVKSNAIVVTRDGALAGAGAGQMSRVDSVKIALDKAGPRREGAVLASDAFFPFPDSVELAAAAGISAIIQTGGSVKDAEVIAAANRLGVPMVFTGKRHFRH